MRLLFASVLAALVVLFFRPGLGGLSRDSDLVNPVEFRSAEAGENENEANEDSNDDKETEVKDGTQGSGSGSDTGSSGSGEKESQDESGPVVRIGGDLTFE